MTIRNWPEDLRPREKLLIQGAASLSDSELLAIFLRTGVKGMNALEMAQHLLDAFGGLRALLHAAQTDFCAYHGLGDAKYVQLQAVMEMARRYLSESIKRGDCLSSPDTVKLYLRERLRNYEHEVFAVLFLDQKNRLISYEELFIGTLDGASVYPREVVKKVLAHNAAAVIFSHNHPSGNAAPSQADIHITERLKQALQLIDVRVLDHFVVGEEVCSFAEQGLL